MSKVFSLIIVFVLTVAAPLLTYGFDVTGDEVSLSGTISSIVLTAKVVFLMSFLTMKYMERLG